jgi:histidinol-phosphatase
VEQQVRACRPLALRYFRSSRLAVERKADHSPVTAADRAVEERLRRALARRFPGETIVGEEFGLSGRQGGSYWTIDPIDGTRAFSRGLPSWGIMLGKVEHGKSVLGLIDFPAINVTIGAATGVKPYERTAGGVALLPRAKPVSSLRDAVIFHGGARWWKPTPYAAGFMRLVTACYLERAYGDCFGYLWAMRGAADAVLDHGVKLWDMAPLAAFAPSTGRVLIDLSGAPSFTGPDTLFTHPSLAGRILNLLKSR